MGETKAQADACRPNRTKLKASIKPAPPPQPAAVSWWLGARPDGFTERADVERDRMSTRNQGTTPRGESER